MAWMDGPHVVQTDVPLDKLGKLNSVTWETVAKEGPQSA